MTKDELLSRFWAIVTEHSDDKEACHVECDKLLLEYADCSDITTYYDLDGEVGNAKFWYS